MKNSHGLTLIELMVTLAVFAIISALAFPGFRLYQQNSNRVSQINGLVSTFNLARSEAVKRSQPVIVCASADQANCSNSIDWTTGWIAVIDNDNSGLQDGAETAFYAHGQLSGANLILGDVANDATTQIIFSNTGASNLAATFMRCDDRINTDGDSTHARAIILTTSGRTRLSQDTNGDNIYEGTVNGTNLDCTKPPA